MGRRSLKKIAPDLDLSSHLFVAEAEPTDESATRERGHASDQCEVPGPRHPEAIPLLPRPFDAAALFVRRAPLEIEVGSGKGLFLMRAAEAQPEHDFFGIELARKYARFTAARLARAGVTNAKVMSGDALRFFRDLPRDAGLAAVHVYFPDPWWKKRHRKRRVMCAPFLQDIEQTLAPGGAFHFWTDVEEYFAESVTLIAAETALVGPLQVPERPAEGDLDFQTHFERRMRLSHQQVYRAEYRKSAT